MALHKVLGNWGEAGSGPDPNNWMPPYGPAQPGDATWLHTFYPNSNWTTPGGDFASTASASIIVGNSSLPYKWTSNAQLVSDVQNWVNMPDTNFGWLLKGNETIVSSKMFHSSESANPANWPTLIVDFTPPTVAPTLAIAATDAVKPEGLSGSTAFTFTVTRAGDTTGTSSVSYAATGSGANAAAANDFTGGLLPAGTVAFAANETSKVITINVAGDATVESNEGFTVTLAAPVGATIATAAALGNIQNDDAALLPTLAIAATDAVKPEGLSGSTAFTFTVTRAGDTAGTSSVSYAVTGSGANAAAATDFTGGLLPSGTVAFAANETSKVVTINVAGDATVESNEGFTVTLAAPVGATIATAAALGNIQNDDAALLPTLAITATDAVKPEGLSGSTAFTFTVTRAGDTAGTSSVSYAVTGSGANAAAANDFTGGLLPAGTVAFAANEPSKVITINVAGDATVQSNEGFTVTLAAPVGATIATAAALGNIQNDDAALLPTLAITATDAVKPEGLSGSTAFTFTVTRAGDTAGTSSVSYAVTGSGANAAAANDFTGGLLPAGTVAFAANEPSKVITINVAGDATVESNEGFTVTLAAPVGATIATAAALGNIQNDDAALLPTLAITATDAVKPEGLSGSTAFTFTVTRAGDTAGTSSVSYAVTGSGANAAAATDFTGGLLPAGTVAFAANEPSKVITINVAGDATVESNEGFTVTLAAPVGATIATAAALGNIQNDDAALLPTLAIAATDAVKPEGLSGSTAFTFTVTRAGDTAGTSSVSYAVTGSGANAAAANDFTGGLLPAGTVAFAANEPSKVITINVAGDATVESNEGFTVTLAAPVGATIATAAALGNIQNDDAALLPTLAITATDAVKPEGLSGSTPFTFTVTRAGDTTGTSSVSYAVTGSGANAAAANDFTGGLLPAGTVAFAANETSKVVTINVAGDATVESNEGFTVTLAALWEPPSPPQRPWAPSRTTMDQQRALPYQTDSCRSWEPTRKIALQLPWKVTASCESTPTSLTKRETAAMATATAMAGGTSICPPSRVSRSGCLTETTLWRCHRRSAYHSLLTVAAAMTDSEEEAETMSSLAARVTTSCMAWEAGTSSSAATAMTLWTRVPDEACS